MTTLRQVLSEAPNQPEPGSKEWGTPAQSLDFDRSGAFDFYVWGKSYLRRVLGAVRGTVEQLGPSTTGWASARWEVYDKVRLAASSLFTNARLTGRLHSSIHSFPASRSATIARRDNGATPRPAG